MNSIRARESGMRAIRPSALPIIVHCHLRWDSVWQWPQQIFFDLHPIRFDLHPIRKDNQVEHNGVEDYRGSKIMWDISEIDGSGFWKATAAVVTPPGAWSAPAVTSVPDIPGRFNSEEEARESVLRMAREVVDGRSSRPVKVNPSFAASDLTNRFAKYSSTAHSPEIFTRGCVLVILIAAFFLFAIFYDHSSSGRN